MIDGDNPQLEVSCPECGRVLTTAMAYEDKESMLPEALTSMFNSIIGNISHYSFKGAVQCECGHIVNSCVTVSSQKRRLATCAQG